jgi:hypothetical protein
MAVLARFVSFGEGWLLTVPVMLNSVPTWYRFAIHTGTVHAAVSDGVIKALNLEPTAGYSMVLDPQMGRLLREPQCRIESLVLRSVDDRAIGTPYVYAVRLGWASELEIDGVLGTQWLRQEFGRLDLDLVTPSVELHRRG